MVVLGQGLYRTLTINQLIKRVTRMRKVKLYFDNAGIEGDDKALACGSIGDSEVIFSIHPKVAEFIGAELMVHEFNEVALFDVLKELGVESFYMHKKTSHIFRRADLAHNLNAEGDDEYTEEHNLLQTYVRSDRPPIIDHVFTKEETHNLRKLAHPESY